MTEGPRTGGENPGRAGQEERSRASEEVELDPQESLLFRLFVDSSEDRRDYVDVLREATGEDFSVDDATVNGLSEIKRIRDAYGEARNEIEEVIRRGTSQASSLQPRPVVESESGLKAGDRFGDYEILEEIVGGSYATIFRARDERASREVVLKILHTNADLSDAVVARFIRGARALAQLRDEHIIRIYHVLEEEAMEGGLIGLCTEFIRGQSLRDYALAKKASGSRIDFDEIRTIGIDLSRALSKVHAAGFIHRDIKADNVMREEGGRIVLMDFGIARSIDSESRVTATGVLVGTPVAMSPEQYEFQDADEGTDVYGVGCLLYFLAAQRYPVEGRSMEEIRQSVLDANYPPLRELRPDIPEDLEHAIQKAMERDRKRRFESAEVLAEALEAREVPRPRAPFPPAVVALLVGIFGALIAILWILLSGN